MPLSFKCFFATLLTTSLCLPVIANAACTLPLVEKQKYICRPNDKAWTNLFAAISVRQHSATGVHVIHAKLRYRSRSVSQTKVLNGRRHKPGVFRDVEYASCHGNQAQIIYKQGSRRGDGVVRVLVDPQDSSLSRFLIRVVNKKLSITGTRYTLDFACERMN